MAKVIKVKSARQRYGTVPVIDPATGKQKVTPVMKSDGSQKLTKAGRPPRRVDRRLGPAQPGCVPPCRRGPAQAMWGPAVTHHQMCDSDLCHPDCPSRLWAVANDRWYPGKKP